MYLTKNIIFKQIRSGNVKGSFKTVGMQKKNSSSSDDFLHGHPELLNISNLFAIKFFAVCALSDLDCVSKKTTKFVLNLYST